MSLLVVGLSHHLAPLEILEAVAADADRSTAFEAAALAGEHVREAMVLSTCNRTELYADALTFHGALAELTAALGAASSVSWEDLQPFVHVHYEERAVAHTFSVAAGLDSMAIGEDQILGQLRTALRRGQAHGHVGPVLNTLVQRALRVGKRVHAETGIDRVSGSLIEAGLDHVQELLGELAGLRVLVVGAGGMGALAATTARRRAVGSLSITNRGPDRARSLAGRLGAEVVAWEERADALVAADVVITSTGAPGTVLTREMAAAAQQVRRTAGDPRPVEQDPRPASQVYLDLAVPHDIDPGVRELPGVTLVGLAELGPRLGERGHSPELDQARDLLTVEVAAYIGERAADSVTPTVRALRAGADQIVAEELARLDRRLLDLDPVARGEVERTVRRVVDKLLHTPTVRVKELAEQGHGGSYARALSELFDLDPADVALVSTPIDLPFPLDGLPLDSGGSTETGTPPESTPRLDSAMARSAEGAR